jgi:hypothetical protein
VSLQPGCRVVVAPSFHLSFDGAERLRLAAGVERDGSGFFPCGAWRPPDERELTMLLADPTVPLSPQVLAEAFRLFRLPQHLCAAWWRLLEQAQAAGTTGLKGFDRFTADVAALLAFKEIPVPDEAAFDLILADAGQRSVFRPGSAGGLAFNLPETTPLPLTDLPPGSGLWGAINLGDGPASLLYVNQPARALLAELARRHPRADPPTTFAELAERFLACCPDYPAVRLCVEPGEGFRLPAGGVLVDGDTEEAESPVALLLVRH